MTIYSFLPPSWAGVVALGLWFSSGAVARTPLDVDGALLRCDPWTVIKSIDGRSSRVKALQAGAFTDCEIPLSAGSHLVKICYEARGLQQTGTTNVVSLYQCERDQEVKFDADAGRIYRIKLTVQPRFTAHVDDVTDAEGGFPAASSASKAGRMTRSGRPSTILVRIIGGGMPSFLTGVTQNHWFKASRLQQALKGSKRMRLEAGGYLFAEVSGGDTIAIRSVLLNDLTSFVCDTEVPVYEDLPGGQVLYLGDYLLEPHPGGVQFKLMYDEDAARQFLRTTHPELVEKLGTARFRQLQVPEPCMLLPVRNRLRQAPAE